MTDHRTVAPPATLPLSAIHSAVAVKVANAAALAALTVASGDDGKLALQADTNTLWFYDDDSSSWIFVGGGSVSGIPQIDQVGGTTGTYGTITGTPDGARVTFTTSATPVANATFKLYVNTLLQTPDGDDYSLSGSTITMTVAPPTGSILIAEYYK